MTGPGAVATLRYRPLLRQPPLLVPPTQRSTPGSPDISTGKTLSVACQEQHHGPKHIWLTLRGSNNAQSRLCRLSMGRMAAVYAACCAKHVAIINQCGAVEEAWQSMQAHRVEQT